MLSGRYRTDRLLRHFSDNEGVCNLCDENASGGIDHLLVFCSSLKDIRTRMTTALSENTEISEKIRNLILCSLNSTQTAVQFILDCSVLPNVITLRQSDGPTAISLLFKFTRSWCYNIHKNRLKLLGRWYK